MKKFIKTFNNVDESSVNLPLANREIEPPLYEFVLDVFRSFDKTNMITLVDWKHVEDESKINITKFNITRKKQNNPRKDKTSIVNIEYDRCTLLWMLFRIEVKGSVAYKDVNLLLPKYDDNKFLTLKGKSVYLLYQLVNSSTYVTKNSVTLKGMMPLCINRQSYDVTDSEGNQFTLPIFKILNFNKEFNPLLLFSARMGFYNAIDLMDCSQLIKIVTVGSYHDPKWKYFPIIDINTKKAKPIIEVAVPKELFYKYNYMKVMTALCCHLLNSSEKANLVNLTDTDYWLDEIGFLYTGDRTTSRDIGKSTLIFFERLIDETNKRTLRMYEYNKRNVYTITTTLIQNFDELKKKDNNDINYKRLRLNEYIGAITSLRMGKSINRILSKGDKVTLDEVVSVLKIAPNLIFRLLYKSPLITYNDIVNDMDFFNKFKFSTRGPNALGSANERKITARDRGVPISSIGHIDADVCSSSSPGLGGLVSPFAKTDGLYFNADMEVQDSVFEMIRDGVNYLDKDQPYIDISDTYEEYIKFKRLSLESLETFITIKASEDEPVYIRLADEIEGISSNYLMSIRGVDMDES